MSKRKKVAKIFVSGVLSQIVTLLLGIIIPRLMIVSYGSEMNGLVSSVRQVFVYVSLLEAGVGTAALQAMYKPIATGDRQGISEIMAATDHYFRRTGIFYGIVIIALAIIYPCTVQTEIAPIIIVLVILFLYPINYCLQV